MTAPSIDQAGLQFVDTNVIVYAYDDSTGEKHRRARALMSELWDGRKGCLSLQVLQEFYVNITRKVIHPLEADLAGQIVEDLSAWKVHTPGVRDVLEAIRLHRKYQISFWDAMILQSARQAGCQLIWSEDLSHEQVYEGIRVINPFDGGV